MDALEGASGLERAEEAAVELGGDGYDESVMLETGDSAPWRKPWTSVDGFVRDTPESPSMEGSSPATTDGEREASRKDSPWTNRDSKSPCC